MMEPTPAAPFKVPQPEFLFQFFVIPFDNPALLGESGEIREFRVGRQRGEPIFNRFGFTSGPLDQQPFFRVRLVAPVVAMGWPYAHRGKPRTKILFRTLSPGDRFPG